MLSDDVARAALFKTFQNRTITKFSPLTGTYSTYDGKVESVVLGFATEVPEPWVTEN